MNLRKASMLPFVFTLSFLLVGCDRYISHEITVSLNNTFTSNLIMFDGPNCTGTLYHPIKIKTQHDNHGQDEHTHFIFSVSEHINLLLTSKIELSLCINHQSQLIQIWADAPDINHDQIEVTCNTSGDLDYRCHTSSPAVLGT